MQEKEKERKKRNEKEKEKKIEAGSDPHYTKTNAHQSKIT
jgi:hypothetical protein